MSAIYLHIPFCKQACHYCDFHFSTNRGKQQEVVAALARELVLRKGELGGAAVETIYFGGGTPSLLSAWELNLLMQTIRDNFSIAVDPEITLEANPDDITTEKLDILHNAGINRLSIGVQSFRDEDLQLMNRAHKAVEARACLEMALERFDNISIDLIYGIPGLSKEVWEENLQIALAYKVPHISSYALTVEPRTALKKFIDDGKMPNPSEEEAEIHFRLLRELLAKEGFVHYEVSNFGKPGYFSRNNIGYWQGKAYLGIGPSAHSFDGNRRKWNIRNNTLYLKGIKEGRLPYEEEILTATDRYNEYVMTGLRTIWGVALREVEDRFGLNYYEYLLKEAAGHLNRGLLSLEGGILAVTDKGRFLADGIASDLFVVSSDTPDKQIR